MEWPWRRYFSHDCCVLADIKMKGKLARQEGLETSQSLSHIEWKWQYKEEEEEENEEGERGRRQKTTKINKQMSNLPQISYSPFPQLLSRTEACLS